MASNFSVTVIGGEKLHVKLDDGIPKPIKRMGFQVRGHMLKWSKIEADPPGSTHRIANSIKGAFVANEKIAFKARIWSNNPVAVDVEEGRKGGTLPTIAAVRRWAKRRGLSTHPAILRKLRKAMNRTKGLHFMGKTAKSTQEELPRYIREAEDAIRAEWNK